MTKKFPNQIKIVLYINKKINDSLVCSNVLEELVNNKAFDAGVVNMLISNKLKAYHEKLHGIVMKIVVLGYPQLGIPKKEPIFDFEDESFDNVMTWEEITEDFTDEFTKEYDDEKRVDEWEKCSCNDVHEVRIDCSDGLRDVIVISFIEQNI